MKYRSLIFLLALFIPQLIFSENTVKIQINDVYYEITGSTRVSFLERELKVDKNRLFSSEEELAEYCQKLKQQLINLRIFENEAVEYSITDNRADLTITLTDSFSIFAIPYPKFNSESGGRIALKAFWFNTLGTLMETNLFSGFYFSFNENRDFIVNQWNVDLHLKKITLGNRQYSFSVQQLYDDDGKSNDYYSNSWEYYSTSLSFGTSFGLPMDMSYGAGISFSKKYGYAMKSVDFTALGETASQSIKDEANTIIADPLSVSYNHGISFYNSENWHDNFRKGYKASIGNTISLSLDESENSVHSNLSLTGAGYWIFGRFNLATRLTGFINFQDESRGLGSYVRGVDSRSLYGDLGIFSNTSLYISTINWDGVGEAQFAPFFDIGYANGSDKFKYGSGADFILYLDKLKSLRARATVGFDLTKDYENFKDFLKSYQLDITSSLFF